MVGFDWWHLAQGQRKLYLQLIMSLKILKKWLYRYNLSFCLMTANDKFKSITGTAFQSNSNQ